MLRLLNENPTQNIQYFRVLKRVRGKLSIFQTDMTKQWRVTFDKRVVSDDDFNTLPYGY